MHGQEAGVGKGLHALAVMKRGIFGFFFVCLLLVTEAFLHAFVVCGGDGGAGSRIGRDFTSLY